MKTHEVYLHGTFEIKTSIPQRNDETFTEAVKRYEEKIEEFLMDVDKKQDWSFHRIDFEIEPEYLYEHDEEQS